MNETAYTRAWDRIIYVMTIVLLIALYIEEIWL